MTLKPGLEVMSLNLVPFKSLGTVSYPPSVVTMAVALSVTVREIFSVKEWCDLENTVQGHWKWHHLIDRVQVPICLSN